MKKYKILSNLIYSFSPIGQFIVKKIVEKEEAIIKGKILATSCGHPEWKNICRRCGEIEISIFEKECKQCKIKLGCLLP